MTQPYTQRISLPSSPFLTPPKSAAEAPLAGGSGLLEATRRVVEEALEEMLLTSAVPVALIECDEVISKVGGQTMGPI